MVQILTTESGDLLLTENAAGIAGASSLNDSSTALITKETFETNPLLRGWLIGSGWAWDAVNLNMKPV